MSLKDNTVVIDSHCHLADRVFSADLDVVLERARSAGVSPLVTIADSLEEGERCLALAQQFDDVYCTVGVHPHVAKQWNDGDADRLKTMLASSTKAVAVGEIGLDYHYDNSPRDVQRKVFRKQLEIAKELHLPVVVHCREAIDDVRKIVEGVQPPALVLHCCTELFSDVEFLIDCGYLLSFTGIATYPKAEAIRDTIKRTPIEQMMIETDAPYLAPVPHRGKRNEPALVVEVAKLIAELKSLHVDDVAQRTAANAVAFFALPT